MPNEMPVTDEAQADISGVSVEGGGEEPRVAVITMFSPHSLLKEQMRDGSGGTIAYSNHELGIVDVDLTFTPIEYTVGDPDSEEAAIQALLDVLRPISVAVQRGFQEQVARIMQAGRRMSPPSRM